MNYIIDIGKSIASRRLIYKNSGAIVDKIITYIGSLLFIFLACALLVSKFSVMPIIIILMNIAFIIWMISNIVLQNIFIKISGTNVTDNREMIIKILNEHFKINIENHDQEFIKDVKLSGFIHWGRVIIVLFNENAIYINIQTLGRGNALSFFHGLTNYLKSKWIARRFSNSIKSS